jgi:tetratricopeptide (TPR) repeat protein
MKKIALSILIVIAIPILAYVGISVYAMYFYEADPATQAYLNEKDPKKKLELLENILDEDQYSRWAWLDDAAELAYETEAYEKAKAYSLESLSLSGNYQYDWNYGNSIHNSNMVLGRLSLKDGDIEKAKEYLLESAKSKGSPQLDSFGPSLKLANELLIAGERDVVLSYLHSISMFWEMDDGYVSQWITQIENNETPKLCNCGCSCK